MDDINTTIVSMRSNLTSAWGRVADKGGSTAGNHNMQNLPDAIRSIPALPPYDPSNPTLDGLKAALQASDYSAFPAGTEIPDEYNGQSNPLIVAQYLDSSNNSSYGGAEGVILVRKWVEPTNVQFNSTNSPYYNTSFILNYLENTYDSQCSPDIQNLVSNINIPYYDALHDNMISLSVKWFLMSNYEVCSQSTSNKNEGVMWNYWQNQTGYSSPGAREKLSSGRVVRNRENSPTQSWLRTWANGAAVDSIRTNGSVNSATPSNQFGILPACFISKN